MRLNKLRISKDLTLKLRVLKSRTQLTPNILCRLGLMLSLQAPPTRTDNVVDFPEDGAEFNRYTLLGEWDALVIALLREAQETARIGPDLETAFRFHLTRGVNLLYPRVKSLADVLRLVPSDLAKKAEEVQTLQEVLE